MNVDVKRCFVVWADWAVGNMNWVDVERVASFLRHGPKPDMQDEWLSASKEVVENPQTPEPDMAIVELG